MLLEIAQRFCPFSHLPGICFMLPGSSFMLQLFPALIKAIDLSKAVSKEVGSLSLHFKGPLEKFTAKQDLERQEVVVWGEGVEGFLRCRFKAAQNSILFFIEKQPNTFTTHRQGVFLETIDKALFWQKEGKVLQRERLALGGHKTQDWELMKRRSDFSEIFPIWHALGQMTPLHKTISVGTVTLLDEVKRAIESHQPEKILPEFKKLWWTGFQGGLVPRLIDEDFLGILENRPILESEASALPLLTEGYLLIRSLFLQVSNGIIKLLPVLPPAFHCGRLLQAICPLGIIQMEWTKKKLRRAIFQATETGTLTFYFYRGEKRCRLRLAPSENGTTYHAEESIEIEPGQIYWLDQFQS